MRTTSLIPHPASLSSTSAEALQRPQRAATLPGWLAGACRCLCLGLNFVQARSAFYSFCLILFDLILLFLYYTILFYNTIYLCFFLLQRFVLKLCYMSKVDWI